SAGSIVVDGRTISYEGLEPVTITGTTNVTVEANDCDVPILCDETITIEQDSGTGEVTVDSLLMERHDITMPASGGSLTILGKGGKDTVQFTTDLVLPKVDLTVDAEDIEVEEVTIDRHDRQRRAQLVADPGRHRVPDLPRDDEPRPGQQVRLGRHRYGVHGHRRERGQREPAVGGAPDHRALQRLGVGRRRDAHEHRR